MADGRHLENRKMTISRYQFDRSPRNSAWLRVFDLFTLLTVKILTLWYGAKFHFVKQRNLARCQVCADRSMRYQDIAIFRFSRCPPSAILVFQELLTYSKIQDGGRPPYWKSKNHDISVTTCPILAKLGTLPNFILSKRENCLASTEGYSAYVLSCPVIIMSDEEIMFCLDLFVCLMLG